MKHISFLLLIACAAMITACSTSGTNSESNQGSATDTTPAAPAKTTESKSQTSTETATEEKPVTQAPAPADSSPEGSDIAYVCTHGNSVRTIRVLYHSDGPKVCEVTYEKSTGTRNLWNANNDKTYCEDKALEFVAKQEGWGWECSKQ